MNAAGEIKSIEEIKEMGEILVDLIKKRKEYYASGGKGRLALKKDWWFECQKPPTPTQIKYGLKGHHICLCGSGKKFRNCCRKQNDAILVKEPELGNNGQEPDNRNPEPEGER